MNTHTLTVAEDTYHDSANFIALCNAHDVTIEIAHERYVGGSWDLEISVTGVDADVFARLCTAIFCI